MKVRQTSLIDTPYEYGIFSIRTAPVQEENVDEKAKLERRAALAEAARLQLAEGTWPQVLALFRYYNPRAPLTEAAEFERIALLYRQANLQHLATFTELVQLKERSHNIVVSFNFSMGPRSRSHAGGAATFFGFPDILVGTRNGVEGAAAWLRNFAVAIPELVPESVQVMDKIFGEALTVIATGSSGRITFQDMLAVAAGGDFPPLTNPPPKH